MDNLTPNKIEEVAILIGNKVAEKFRVGNSSHFFEISFSTLLYISTAINTPFMEENKIQHETIEQSKQACSK